MTLKTKSSSFLLALFLFLPISTLAQTLPSTPRLLIRFQPDASAQSLVHHVNKHMAMTLSSSEGEILRNLTSHPSINAYTLEVHSDQMEETLNELRKNPEIVYAEEDEEVHAQTIPNDPHLNLQWSLNKTPNIGAEIAWDYVTEAPDLIIAHLDSGCDLNHEDLQPNLWKNTDEIPNNHLDDDGNGYVDDDLGYNFFQKTGIPQDDYGHGTQVAGVLGAAGNNALGVTGVVWKTRIMCLKVLNSKGDSNISTAIEAIQYAINQKADLINISWGYTPKSIPSYFLQDAIRKAKSAGLLVIASAGNGLNNLNGVNNDLSPQSANYPSSYPEENIIAVASTDPADHLTGFSNYGPITVDIAAPGVSIYSIALGNHYDYFEGTSASTPFVTGSAALLWQLNPSLDYQQIKDLLLENADELPSLKSKILSEGRLNIGKAIQNSPAITHLYPTGGPSDPTPNAATGTGGGCQLMASPAISPSILDFFCLGFFGMGWFFKRKKAPQKL